MAQEPAKNGYIPCLYEKAIAFDDGTSDALSIARAIVGMCRAEIAAYVESKVPETDRRSTRIKERTAQLIENDLSAPSQIVLAVRKQKREALTAPPAYPDKQL